MLLTHPEPASDFATLDLPIVDADKRWCRIHRRKLAPIFFGRTRSNRFDAPKGEFGVLYVADDFHGAFIETFGRETGIRTVMRKELQLRHLCLVSTSRPLRLVDLTGEGLARIGADAALTNGLNYKLAHRWALAIHEHPATVDGILYRARHDPARPCVAIFERAAGILRVQPLGPILDAKHAKLLGDIFDVYRFGVSTPPRKPRGRAKARRVPRRVPRKKRAR